MAAAPGVRRSELGDALRACRNAFIGVGLMSCMINLLYLTGSIFMLEVYDRVLPSRSIPTLVGLVILAGGLYVAQGILDLIRGRVLVRFVERGADAPQDPSPEQVEPALGDVEEAGENDQADQGRHAAAWQHPVVDLQHENRAGQIQQIDHATHDADADKGAAAGTQRFTEFGSPDTGSGCH